MNRALAALCGLAACSAPALPAALARAYQLEKDGDVDGALAAYREAQRGCDVVGPSLRQREDCARALTGEAALLADAGRTDDAIVAYAAIPERSHDYAPAAAEGLFRAGRLAYAADRVPEAARWLWRVIESYPDEAFAGDAVAFIVEETRADDPRALWTRLSAAFEPLQHTDVADNVIWALAELAAHELADPVTAIELYDRIPVDHPTSGLRDDARWRAANLARERGDAAGAVTRLRGLLATREVAFGAGSYFSIWLDDAQLLLGRILRDDLGDPAAAAAAFARLPEDYPRSILVDDALDELAALAEAGGDTARACRAAARLLRADAESRFAPVARARQARLGCPETGR